MSKKKRSRQFGVRKLLLWTAVVAFLLGVFKWAGGGPVDWIFCGWIVTVGAVRVAAGARASVVLSVAIGGTCGILLQYVPHFVLVPILRSATWPHIVAAYVFVFVVGCFFGLIVFITVDSVCDGIDWVDNALRTRSDD